MSTEERLNDGLPDKLSPLDEQLVAYLDGELAVDDCRRIEEMLASDSAVRHRLQDMQRTWDMLDDLDSVPVSSGFTQSTLEMVAVAADADVQQSLAVAPRRRHRLVAWVVVGLTAAIVAGFIAVTLFTPNADQQLLDNLPVLVNLDDYRSVDDIEFLRLLRDQTSFGADRSDVAAESSYDALQHETRAERRARVEAMSEVEKERLARLQGRWGDLTPEEKRRVLDLHEEIMEAPDATQLLKVMHRYGQWLQTMPSYRWSDLAGLEPEARLKSVKNWLDNDPRWLSENERKELVAWMDRVAVKHEAQFLATLPPERKNRVEHLSQDERRRMMRTMLRHLQPGGPGPVTLLNKEDLADLRDRLGADTAEWLGQKSEIEQRRIVAGWILRQVVRQRIPRGPLNSSDELLASFFEDDLSPQERDRLLVLPGEEMQRELLKLYVRHARPTEGAPRRGESFETDDRPGEWRGPAKRGPERRGDRPERPLD